MDRIFQLPNNPSLHGLACYLPDIPFSNPVEGRTLLLQLLKPESASQENRRPLIVFIQGSSWCHPNAYRRLPLLAQFARAGYVVASITHRSQEEAPFPAFLVDVKTAIRFLRAHAGEYGIDPQRVCVWGTSSGGNAALLTALTPNQYHSHESPDESSQVQAVVDCFGPTDIPDMIDQTYPEAWGAEDTLLEHLNDKPLAQGIDKLLAMSPTRLIQPGQTLPPFLLLHGDADLAVDYSQSENFHNKLRENGQDSTLYRIPGAPHEGNFWSPQLLDVIQAFLDEKL